MEHKTGTLSVEYNNEDYEIKRKALETILKKIKKERLLEKKIYFLNCTNKDQANLQQYYLNL